MKNRILIINNYSLRESLHKADQGIVPMHHTWGINLLRDKYNLRFLNFQCPTILKKLHLARFYYYYFQIKSLFYSTGCSCVYSAASPLINLLAYLKWKGLVKCRLIMIVHHPRNFTLQKRKYDKIIFISKDVYDIAIQDYGQNQELFELISWGPDLKFYQAILIDSSNKESNRPLKFMSIGICFRDHDTLILASRGLDCKTEIICTTKNSPLVYDTSIDHEVSITVQNDGINTSGELMSYKQMAAALATSDIVIIPIIKGHSGLCGLTSFNDAIALGKPVIVADTSHLGIDLEYEGIGFYYKAGDYSDLRRKMQYFIDNPDLIKAMKPNILNYAKHNDSSHFAEIINQNVSCEQ